MKGNEDQVDNLDIFVVKKELRQKIKLNFLKKDHDVELLNDFKR